MQSVQNNPKIKKLFNSLNKFDEFEIMFNNFKVDNKLSLPKFVNILKYLKWRSDKDSIEIVNEDTLDIVYTENYNPKNVNTSYRVTVLGDDKINDFLKLVHLRKNHVIYSILMTQFINDKSFSFMKKIKDPVKVVDFEEYDIRFRVSSEKPLDNKAINDLANIPLSQGENIKYRYKNRVSLKLINTDNEKLSIDLTIVKTSNNPNNITKGEKTFEIEIDYMSTKLSEKSLDMILNESNNIKKVLEESQVLTQKNELEEIIQKYKDMVYGSNNNNYKNAYSMQPRTAEVQHIVDKIANKYSVTDKADGNKFVLFIYNNNVYMITTNLGIKKLDVTIKGYDNSILEGEMIHLTHVNKYLFMAFDCQFYKGEDIRSKFLLKERLTSLRDVCNKLTPTKYSYNEFKLNKNGSYEIKEQKKFYQSEIENFYSILNKHIDNIKTNEIVFHSKLFIFPSGAYDSEVFLYSYLIWYNCTKNDKIRCPYILDGVIYTGIEQKYTRDKREHKYPTYKFKPPEMNSLDVYIEFQKNPETGNYMDIFDNTLPDSVEDQIFRVTNFYVGDVVGTIEKPVPFMKESDNHEAFLPIEKGQVRDIEGNIVQSNTVIEIVYNNDSSIPHQYRWRVLRTRWDKTESVLRNKKTYGNFKDTAISVWKSMIEAVTIEEIKILSNPDSYIFQKKQLEARIDSSVIISERQQDIYYQKNSKIAKKMRSFHNWIKSVIIYTYCQPFKSKKNSESSRTNVLDLGCGRGGDNEKFYHARVGNYVGVDVDFEGLYSSIDGAVKRYEKQKKIYPDFGKMTFIQADGGVLLNSEEQNKSIPKMSKENKDNIERIFSKKNQFDIINASFSLHYMFGTKLTVNNFIENIKNNLKVGGFILFEIFDAEKVMKLLGDDNKYTSYYTDEDGKKLKFFEIVKKFNGELKDKPGEAIDVFLSMFMEEGKYIEEYLVSNKLLIDTMKKAGCHLVDTEYFSTVYEMNKEYFTKAIEYEENPKNKKFYKDVATFYDNLKGIDKESKIYSFLNRYYIFKKLE